MGFLHLDWDNSAALLNPNVIAQRASKRVKTVGGAWSTTGFTPSNDLVMIAVPSMIAAVTDNKVYEFKIESICSVGGPTPNTNGVQENIAFACIIPSLGGGLTTVSVLINLASTDITKVRLVLRKQVDNLIIGGPVIVNNVADAASYSFTGLTANTRYYVTIELYATVNGIDVISSDAAYLGAVCGGNVSGYQVITANSCATVNLQATVGTASISYTNCSGTVINVVIPNTPTIICTDGGAITVVSGSIAINSTTPGSC